MRRRRRQRGVAVAFPALEQADLEACEKAAQEDAAAYEFQLSKSGVPRLPSRTPTASAPPDDGMQLPTEGLPYQERLERECLHEIESDIEGRFGRLQALTRRPQGQPDPDDLADRAEQAEQQAAGIRTRLESLPRPHWTGRIGPRRTAGILLMLGSFEFAILRTALDLVRMDDGIRNLIAVFFGVIPIITIEINGGQIFGLLRWHLNEKNAILKQRFATAVLSLLSLSMIGFVTTAGFVRADGFSSGQGIFANTPHRYAISLGIALTLLQVIATLGAVTFSREQAEGDLWRDLRRQLDEAEELADSLNDDALEASRTGERNDPQLDLFVDLARARHREIADYYGALDAAYRVVLRQRLPEVEDEVKEVWNRWRRALMTYLEHDYNDLNQAIDELTAFDDEETETVAGSGANENRLKAARFARRRRRTTTGTNIPPDDGSGDGPPPPPQ